jgi:hypothetical protein
VVVEAISAAWVNASRAIVRCPRSFSPHLNRPGWTEIRPMEHVVDRKTSYATQFSDTAVVVTALVGQERRNAALDGKYNPSESNWKMRTNKLSHSQTKFGKCD